MQSRDKLLWGLLAGAALLLLLAQTKKGAAIAADIVETVASGIRGFRLNNPFNIEKGSPWEGLAADQPDARFCKFVSMSYGVRAWAKLMLTYASAYNIRSVADIVNRYNPPADGQPSSYIPTVAGALGVDAAAPLDLSNRYTVFSLARAMMAVEIGSAAAAFVSDADVTAGLDLAGIPA
jgi:hypothetical protein